jgi:hypothetical protein
MTTVDEFVQGYSQALWDHNAAVMAGAGLSIPVGLVNWKQLMRTIAKDVGLDVEKETDLVAIAQYHLNETGGRHKLHQTLVNEFSERAALTPNHRILARLPIDTYWTTNYDQLLEQALRDAGKRPDVKATGDNLATTLPRRDAVVYKMHGDVADPAKAVITKDDYEAYLASSRGQLFSTALKGDLVSKTFLFLGFSFSDPNVDYILSRIRILLQSGHREHYCLMRRVHRDDFQKNKDYQYASVKQQLQIKDLRRYGIQAVMLDSFDQFTKTLTALDRQNRRRSVFISGSAASYAPWSDSQAQEFLVQLAKELAALSSNIVTGFGLGVGPHIVNGVLEQLESEGTRNLTERITLRPFPYAIADASLRKKRWTSYRKQMIDASGIALFIFGNAAGTNPRDVVLAEGMREEFELAVAAGVTVLPVGATGYVAQELHEKVSAQFGTYFPKVSGLKSAFAALNKGGSPNQIVQRVVRVIKILRDR